MSPVRIPLEPSLAAIVLISPLISISRMSRGLLFRTGWRCDPKPVTAVGRTRPNPAGRPWPSRSGHETSGVCCRGDPVALSSAPGRAMRVIIIGGGIGGLTAAAALRRAGVDTVVLERRTQLEELHSGGGMVLWHNAIRGLQHVGLAERIQAAGTPLREMTWFTCRGKRVASWPVDKLDRTAGVSAVGITR